MATGKQTILEAIRLHRPAAAPLPELVGEWSCFDNPRLHFIEVLASVGGQAYSVKNLLEVGEQLRTLPAYAEAKKIVSLVPGAGEPTVDLAQVTSPHELEDVDIAILPGEFAVAENGAVWVTDQNVPLRALFYICQHLVLVVSGTEILNNLHAAYERLGGAGKSGGSLFAEPVFGAFISGPSKTADIEQSLVIGAHGPRSLTVFLVGE